MASKLVILAALVGVAHSWIAPAPLPPAWISEPNIGPAGYASPSEQLSYPSSTYQYLDAPIFFDNYQRPEVKQSVSQGHSSQNYLVIQQNPVQLPFVSQQSYGDAVRASLARSAQPQLLPVVPQPAEVTIQPVSPVLSLQPQPLQLAQVDPLQLAHLPEPLEWASWQQPSQLAQLQRPVKPVQLGQVQQSLQSTQLAPGYPLPQIQQQPQPRQLVIPPGQRPLSGIVYSA